MPSPLVTFKNSTQVFVEWGHLFHKGGPIKQFDLKITHQNLGLSKVVAVDAMHNSYSLSLADLGREQDWIPDCFNDSITNLYNFSIRAITFDPKTEDTFAGDWSPIEVTPAYCKGNQIVNDAQMDICFFCFFLF